MTNKLKKIGLLAFIGNGHGGGVYQYTQSLIDALSTDKEFEYVIFTDIDENRFDDYSLEVRKINKPRTSIFKKTVRLAQLYFKI
jgi:hypothetical protein